MRDYQLHWYSDVHPLVMLVGLFVVATAMAWWPGFWARRHHHPHAHAVSLAGWAWLFVTIPLLYWRRDLSVWCALAWALVTLAAYVRPRSPRST